MLKDFLKEIVTLVAGKPAENIVDLLVGNKHVNEFLIAKKMNLTINQTRNILYKLSDEGIVSSMRKKDRRKGWYIYFWKIENLKSLELLRENYKNKISQISHQIENRENKIYYVCEKCGIEFNEENALLNNFTCPECGSVFVIKDNTKFIKELKKNFDRYKKKLSLIESEIEKEKQFSKKKIKLTIKAKPKKAKKVFKVKKAKRPKKKITKKKSPKKIKKKIKKKR